MLAAGVGVDEDAGSEEDRAHQQEFEARGVNQPDAVERCDQADQDAAATSLSGVLIGLAAEGELQGIGAGQYVGRQNGNRGDEVEELVGAFREVAENEKQLVQEFVIGIGFFRL